MSVLTKTRLTKEQISRMVEAAFPVHHMVEWKELTEGFCNSAYLVQLEDGRETVLKVAPPQETEVVFYEKNMMETEVAGLKLAADIAKIPVPKVYYYDRSRTICTSEYFFMEKMKGRSLNSCSAELTEEEKNAIFYQIGEYTARLNQVEGAYFGYPGIPELQFDTMKELYRKLIVNTIKAGKKKSVDFGVDYDYILAITDKYADVLDEVTKAHYVHWDIWEGNVFIDNGKVTGIIDFERALYADPLMEYFFLNGDHSNADYLRGYGKEAFTDSEITKRQLYSIYLHLLQMLECPYRQYEDDGMYRWAKESFLQVFNKLDHR